MGAKPRVLSGVYQKPQLYFLSCKYHPSKAILWQCREFSWRFLHALEGTCLAPAPCRTSRKQGRCLLFFRTEGWGISGAWDVGSSFLHHCALGQQHLRPACAVCFPSLMAPLVPFSCGSRGGIWRPGTQRRPWLSPLSPTNTAMSHLCFDMPS